MNIIDIAKKRYSTKEFDGTKKLSKEDAQKVKDLLRFAPSSINLQPWSFIIAETEEGKNTIAKSTQGNYEFNLNKVLKASQVVVFCSYLNASKDHLIKVVEKECKDGRLTEQDKQTHIDGRYNFVEMHDNMGDFAQWSAKQNYINLGAFLLGLGALNIDAVAIEGFDANVLNKEFNLSEKNLKADFIVALGYRSNDDFNAKLPKSRLKEDEIITTI